MTEKKKEKAEPVFTKQALVQSKDFAQHKDVLNALLDDGEYTKSEARKRINAYLKNEIKGGM